MKGNAVDDIRTHLSFNINTPFMERVRCFFGFLLTKCLKGNFRNLKSGPDLKRLGVLASLHSDRAIW